MTKPRLLSPCGSFDALMAALSARADEVYLGLSDFNARAGAENFDNEKIKEALRLCRLCGVKSNITVNTLVSDREIPKVCDMVYSALCEGADAFIVQDIGLANILKKEIPEIVLHASTQCACHNTEGAKTLSSIGFERVVLAREMTLEDIKSVVETGIETEIFLHGALCVCHSGMCLMSSCIGGRSGNRGMCAQPCRLPYSMTENSKSNYPLSLKDLCLAGHINEITDLGVTSLKIEGRMKSPEYVYGVTSLYRKLLDEKRNATREETQYLYDLFSRSGFTDKYFTGEYKKDNQNMYGIRSQSDKERTNALSENLKYDLPKRKISAVCQIESGKTPKLAFTCDEISVVVAGDFLCQEAKNAPITECDIKNGISKLGNTCFELKEQDIKVTLSENVFLTKSMLNSLRRSATNALEKKLLENKTPVRVSTQKNKKKENVAFSEIVYHISCRKAKNLSEISKYPNVKYVSLSAFEFEKIQKSDLKCVFEIGAHVGVRMPRVLSDGEFGAAKALLEKAKNMGASFALVSNIGQTELVKSVGLSLFGSIGLNVYNSDAISKYKELGYEIITLSSELTQAQIRDLNKEGIRCAAFVKGRQELMVLESCIVRANGKCKKQNDEPCTILRDRKGYEFPVFSEKRLGMDDFNCRCIVHNSVENVLTDKKQQGLKNAGVEIFTVMI